jgi:hypothetical protein
MVMHIVKYRRRRNRWFFIWHTISCVVKIYQTILIRQWHKH